MARHVCESCMPGSHKEDTKEEVSEEVVKRGRNVHGPKTSQKYQLEYSVHKAPLSLRKEIQKTFLGATIGDGLLVVPVFQKTSVELVAWGDVQRVEKDRCLEVFMKWGRKVCERIRSRDCWADISDPCSGLPVFGKNSNYVYSDVDASELLLSYRTIDVGGCRVLSHPSWGTAVYPTTLFTTAPLDELLSALEYAEGAD
mmetsp:Transcript_43358/g.70353  ORF Transcript_43358/g.70353 Transcript_43358/m.70353 type:complete len:199 (+) Transcript_43358:16-612(+)